MTDLHAINSHYSEIFSRILRKTTDLFINGIIDSADFANRMKRELEEEITNEAELAKLKKIVNDIIFYRTRAELRENIYLIKGIFYDYHADIVSYYLTQIANYTGL